MNKKKMAVVLGLGLSLGVLASAAAGVSNAKPMEVEAAGTTTTLYLKPNSNWKSQNARFATYFFGGSTGWADMTDPDGDGIYQVEFDHTKYTSFIFTRMNPSNKLNDWSTKWNQTVDLVFNDPLGCDGGKNNLYNYPEGPSVWDKAPGVWSVFGEAAPTMHKVTFDYGYKIAGAKTNYTKTVDVKEGTAVPVPNAMRYGKKAVWDHDFSEPITAPKTITATWVDQTEEMNEIFYVLDKNDPIPTHLYAWSDAAGEDFGNWPGAPIAAEDVTTDLRFNAGPAGTSIGTNQAKVVRVQYSNSVRATNILFNNNSSWQTGVKGSGTTPDKNPFLSPSTTYVGSEDINGDYAMTEALKLVLDVEEARTAVTADEVIKDGSICGIEPAKAKAFYERYQALEPEVQEYVNNSMTNTYVGDGVGNVNFDAIMAQLGVLGGTVNQPLHFLNTRTGSNVLTFTVVGVIALAAIAMSTFFFIRRKKQH